MFVVNSKWAVSKTRYIELTVHCDLTLYRSVHGLPWEARDSAGDWEEETLLDEIVQELWDASPETVTWDKPFRMPT